MKSAAQRSMAWWRVDLSLASGRELCGRGGGIVVSAVLDDYVDVGSLDSASSPSFGALLALASVITSFVINHLHSEHPLLPEDRIALAHHDATRLEMLTYPSNDMPDTRPGSLNKDRERLIETQPIVSTFLSLGLRHASTPTRLRPHSIITYDFEIGSFSNINSPRNA